VLFDDGPLGGTKLVGFGLWKSPDGEIYVTFPWRAFGAASEPNPAVRHPRLSHRARARAQRETRRVRFQRDVVFTT